MAIDLMAEQLVDFHSGQRGLTDKQLTLLHDHSIRDDPTRVIRAARYAARLGFTLDEKTQDQITKPLGLALGLVHQRCSNRGSTGALNPSEDGTRSFVPA